MSKNPLEGRSAIGIVIQAMHSTHTDVAALVAHAANAGDKVAMSWLSRIEQGITDSLLLELEKAAAGICLSTRVSLNRRAQKFEWLREPPSSKKEVPSMEAAFALLLVTTINAGLGEKLKRCAAEGCDNFHFRRGKWCSDTCGGRVRGANKRKKDKQRGML